MYISLEGGWETPQFCHLCCFGGYQGTKNWPCKAYGESYAYTCGISI